MMKTVFVRVFKNSWYLSLVLAIFVFGMSLVLLLPNVQLLSQVAVMENASVLSKLQLVLSLYGSITTSFTLFSAFYTLLAVALFAINIALLVFYVRRAQKRSKRVSGVQVTSIGGVVSGVLGIGCAACGSVILSALVTTFGGATILSVLPLHGGEFALIGIALLSYSIYQLAKKIHDPLVCKLDT